MKKLFVLAVIVFMWAACASLFVPRQILDSWNIDKPFDQVWQVTLETLAEMDFKLAMPPDKNYGLISTEMMNLPENKREWWDAGSLAATQFIKGYRGIITVFVKKKGDSQSQIRVISKFEILFNYTMDSSPTQNLTLYTRPCVSTGALEAEIFKRVSEKTK